MIRCGSRSFFFASLLLPEAVRDGAYALYAFCRLSDDVVDLEGGRSDAVQRLRARLDRVFAGDPQPHPVDRALSDAVLTFGVPHASMDALLEGLQWDADGRVYETLSDVRAYGARVAGSVGAMMAALMGARAPDLVARACDLGVAMQLTNIARDVGEDARAGRLYLPRQWLREEGIDPEAFLAAPAFGPQIARVVERLLAEADTLYARADAGVARLDARFRPAIFAASRLYAGIGHRLVEQGLDSVSRRTTLSARRKLKLGARALASAAVPTRASPAGPPLAETGFLVEAVGQTSPWATAPARPRRLEDDLAWTLDLFASLEWRQRAQRGATMISSRTSRV
jgi:phytoene synthase